MAAAATVVAYNPLTRAWATSPEAGTIAIPNLDGTLVLAGPLLAQAADDFGHIVSHAPTAVLIAGSIRDIAKIIRFARRSGIHVAAMKQSGDSHSTFGQAQVRAGVVIDMSGLSTIHEIQDDSALVDAGVRWIDLLGATVPLGKSPPTLTDYIGLSVGGTVSVGGIGGQAFRHGMIVDNVLELLVVTGTGDVRTCSPTRRPDLFYAVLSGLGQCAIIVRARVRLIEVPAMARRYRLGYSDIGAFTDDQTRLIDDGRFDYVEGLAGLDETGAWRFTLEAVTYFVPGAEPDDATLLADLSFIAGSDTITDSTYFDFVNRLAPDIEFLISIGVWQLPHPWINMFVPAANAADAIRAVLDTTTADDMGGGPVLIYPFKTSRITAPLLPLPEDDTAFLFSLLRTAVPPVDAHDLVDKNRAIYEYLRDLGSKRYAISSVAFTPSDWRDNFGPQRMRNIARAKRRFDPDHVLTPGQGIFR